MGKLFDHKQEFSSARLNKWEYIDTMYRHHSILFEYSDFIKDTNISGIEISDGCVIMTFRDTGIRFICASGDQRLAPFDTLNFGTYEDEELRMQKKMIRPGDTVMDIGANFGWYAMNIAKSFPESNVLSFEPIPDSFQFLSANIQLNNIRNIEVFNYGFSDKPGTENLYFDPKLSVNASLANLSDSADAVKVACHFDTLDHFAFSKGLHVDFIKCDVEGAELLVFKGGREVIARDKPVVFSEMLRKWSAKFDYHPNEIIELFNSLGYSCYTIANEVLSSCSRVDESTVETNFFFLHNTDHNYILNNTGITGIK